MEKRASGLGRAAPRFQEIDLWPLIVQNSWDPADAAFESRVLSYAKNKGGSAMLAFCMKHMDELKSIGEKAWKLENAEKDIAQSMKTRLQVLEDQKEKPCSCTETGKWFRAARALLHANEIAEADLTSSIYQSLAEGRQKGNCVTLCGKQGNEGKSFVLRPLMSIFPSPATFVTPTSHSFPLLEIDRSWVVFFDDFRFSKSPLSLSQLLLLLEAAPLCVSRPQNQHKGHTVWSGTSPVFITTLEDDLMHPKGILPGDIAMIHKRLKVYRFWQVISSPDPSLTPCGTCFAQWVLNKGFGQPQRSLGNDVPEWLQECLESPHGGRRLSALRDLLNHAPLPSGNAA